MSAIRFESGLPVSINPSILGGFNAYRLVGRCEFKREFVVCGNHRHNDRDTLFVIPCDFCLQRFGPSLRPCEDAI
jgi:hypothetical protein